MRIIGRHDYVLLTGFVVAVIVIFARPVRYLLDVAGEVERSSGLALVPALIILSVFFLFHLQAKRQEAKADALKAEAETAQADARAAEMERLVTFGQSLGRSLDFEAIRSTVAQQLPRLVGSETAWVLVRLKGKWHVLLGAAGEEPRETEQAYRHIADQAIAGDAAGNGPAKGVLTQGHLCLQLTAGGESVGVIGIPETAGLFSQVRHRSLGAAAALLAISVRNAQLFREVKEHGLRDGLTGCYNRTHAVELIGIELRRARRSQAATSIIMFDIDHFKQINDGHGHLCGDAVLGAVGERMQAVLRTSDLKCRYGGEEFLVVLPDTPLSGAKQAAENLRRAIADMRLPWKDSVVQVTASFGVTAALTSEVDIQAFIGRADAALYRAKDQGRNCVQLEIETAVA